MWVEAHPAVAPGRASCYSKALVRICFALHLRDGAQNGNSYFTGVCQKLKIAEAKMRRLADPDE